MRFIARLVGQHGGVYHLHKLDRESIPKGDDFYLYLLQFLIEEMGETATADMVSSAYGMAETMLRLFPPEWPTCPGGGKDGQCCAKKCPHLTCPASGCRYL